MNFELINWVLRNGEYIYLTYLMIFTLFISSASIDEW